ncbi:hypothetical protein [Parasphingorhabdus pacifica]
MKRTLTAAAVLASSAGALGFAGTATAAEAPEFPAELPVDNSLANTAFHLAGTAHSATRVVGDVVPVEEKLTGRAGGENPVSTLSTLVTETSPADVFEWFSAAPESATVEEAPDGKPGSSATTEGRAGGALPVDGSTLPVGGVSGLVDNVSNATPDLVGETLPTGPMAGRTEARADLTEGTPLAGVLPPVTAEPHTLLEPVGKLVSHGPVGGVTNLGGN